ncbi:uncharacterized protein MELLADRAFT_110544 [Melampsora larici-populina 98AG31]|uniref:Uncharacterized protein n=1 Tax=Melampsora larici-populina (strain 98AG31 / pathotype 3-4-7) TaxID=747676 RepID=F4S059_MELLP|nr:uncharacterized protein MELLADRAFT_110544 [Melampsora larici-populina 98AG31]EGG01904.1 hypothetical protein MELLADRAFT_110544 [Melampsora larici-populina 98AG31]
MVVATLIHPEYVFVTPGYLPEPPQPGAKAGQPVGIYCPTCHAGLKYWTPKADAWLIGPPTPACAQEVIPFYRQVLQPQPRKHPFQGHVMQGPIVSNTPSWSPPLYTPTASSLLPPPQLLTAQSTASTSGPHLSTPPIPCKRQSQGPVSKGHWNNTNKECRFKFCQTVW